MSCATLVGARNDHVEWHLAGDEAKAVTLQVEGVETLILPALARDEEQQATTQESMFSYVRLSDGGRRRHDGPRSEVETIAAIARGVAGDDGPIDWRSMQRHRTIRSEGQFNAVVYEGHDPYRHQQRREIILMNADGIERFGLAVEQRVIVRSIARVMRDIVMREFPIRAGNAAMYFPEANVLVPMTVDPESRTPAYKSVAITVKAGLPAVTA